MKSQAIGRAGAAALLSVWLAGCNVGPNYKRPQVAPPPAYRGADNTVTDTVQTASLGDQKWATVFQEPELQDLIQTALKNNYDVQIAAKRVLEQQAQVKITRSNEFPTLSVGGTGVGVDLSGAEAKQFGIDNPLAEGDFSLSAAWTPDFWGQYRRATEGARAVLLQQVWAQRAVRMSVVQQVATAYFTLRALDRQLEISKETVKIRQQSVDLTKRLTDGGSSPLSDLRQAEESLYTATSEIPQLEQQIQEEENALKLLLGQDPGTVAHTDPHALDPVPEALPTGIPSRLLEQRPDILEAEEQLINANAQIGVAKAQFFPSLSISASAGVGGDDWGNLFNQSGKTIYGLGSLTQPIFEGGKLKGQLKLAESTKEEMVLNYQKTIKGAFRDVSNALITVNKTKATREQQQRLVASAEDASRLARMRYQAGATSYLEVLTTDATLYSAQLNLITAQQNEALSLVTLYNALGGGWQE
ncbi:efflux transporter outer membrane subunit [Silvibacterium sp.]|uniref:efflux transporter outer membrane subunit n=1 Tax=Silvibacterium sp. TaxID=1964179 RepID=UPI0039E3BE7F